MRTCIAIGRTGAAALPRGRRRRAVGRAVAAAGLAGAAALGAAAHAVDAGPYDRGLLWRVEAPGHPPSHVFATLHSADERVQELPAPVLAALGRSRSLTVEVLVDRTEHARLGRRGLLPPGRALDAVLGTALFDRTVRAVAPLGLGADDIRPFAPWYVAGLLGTHPDEMIRRAGGRRAQDSVLARMAAARGHRLMSLERAAEYFGRLRRIDEADQVRLLAHAVARSGRAAGGYERILRYYRAGETAALRAALVDYRAGDDPALRRLYIDRFILERNELMARRLRRRLAAGNAFAAIGAAHLPGPGGVLARLARDGLRLTRIH